MVYVARERPDWLDTQEKLSRNGSPRWTNKKRDQYYEYDQLHGEVEVYNKRGEHLGVLDAATGVFIKDAVAGRTISV